MGCVSRSVSAKLLVLYVFFVFFCCSLHVMYMAYLWFSENGICPFILLFLCTIRLVVLSPRVSLGLCLVVGSTLGGDGPFILVYVLP